MEITWYGHSCFRMIERGVASLITDPYGEEIGLGIPNLRADIVTVSHDAPGHNAVENVKKMMHVLARPGEYEIGGVFITGIATYDPKRNPAEVRRNIIFVYDFIGLTVCHLGDLNHVPGQSQIEDLGPIDVLLIPVGGGGGLTSGQASDVISLIEPGIVVPMHYAMPGLRFELDPLEKFLKEMGLAADYAVEPVLKVTKSRLEEDTTVILLEQSE